MVYTSSKLEVFDCSEGQKPPIRGLPIIERSWNYGNLPYLVANTYVLNFIKLRGIWIFQGVKTPPIGGYMWPVIPIFELGWPIPVKSHVWKFGLDWLKSEVCEFSGGRSSLLGGLHVKSDAHLRTWLSYSSQKTRVEIWFSLVEPSKSYCVHKQTYKKKKKQVKPLGFDPPGGGLTIIKSI